MSKHNIEIYTTDSCHYCKQAKSFFRKNNIDFIEYNINKDEDKRRYLTEDLGYRSVPIIVIDGDEYVGWDRAVIQRRLGL